MTVSSTANRNGYTGNSTSSSFDYSYRIFQTGDISVSIRNLTTTLETELFEETDYVVNGEGELNGGTIDLVNNGQEWLTIDGFLATGFYLVIRRVIPLKQETDIRNQGDFYPEIHEDVFDKSVMVAQQLQDELDRCVHLPPTITKDQFDPTIPTDIVGRNGLAMVSNEAGDGFTIGPSVSSIAGAAAFATASENSAAASLVSEQNAAASELVVTTLLGPISNKEDILNDSLDITLNASVDSAVYVAGIFEYYITRGTVIEYGRILVFNNPVFNLHQIEKVGDSGVTFGLVEIVPGTASIKYTSTNTQAGSVRYKFIKFEV